ncbi:MAG: hypothetical protein A2283_13695 [Lentisphaerae bacterium RIFOXYA12_FULL_48_11]|nr:MAG: hypothetical protein A2283_13695 [Lentisphaerae bacterium RIFOXYA12_FULL_48_11]
MNYSVIIATCDRPARLSGTLESVRIAVELAGGKHSVIVVDNGVRQLAGDVVSGFVRETGLSVEYLRTDPKNKARALNAGIEAADTEWLAFTDDDTIPDPAWLREASAYISRCSARIFGGKIVAGELGLSVPRWIKEGKDSVLVQYPAIIRYEPMQESGILGTDAIVPFGANLFVEKDVFVQYGGYDEELWDRSGSAALGGEDAEFSMRVRSSGEAIGYCAESVVLHPVYEERTTLWHHLRWAYRAGVREVILFGGMSDTVTFRYRVKLLACMLWNLMCSAGKCDSPGCVGWLMKIMTVLGELTQQCRHSKRVNVWKKKWFSWLWNVVKTHPIPAGWMSALVTLYYANTTSSDLRGIYSGDYYRAYGKGVKHEAVIKKMQALAITRAFPDARRVLVGGCGDGMLVAELRAAGVEAFGFDLSPSVFSVACQEIKSFLRLGSMTKIPFSSQDRFDLLVAVDVVEHVPCNAVVEMARQLFRLGVPFMALVINHKDLGCPGHVTMKPLKWWQKKFAPFFEPDTSITFDREGLVPVYSLDGDPDAQFTFWHRKRGDT